jgi:hypothetical protein
MTITGVSFDNPASRQIMSKDGRDNRDVRRGAYDPVSEAGLPQAAQVKDKTTPVQQEQFGADVRAEPLPGAEPVLPERLVRAPQGPLNPRTGRGEAE